MSLIKKIKFPNETIYDIGSKWSNIDKENIFYDFNHMISFNSDKKQFLKSCIVNIEPSSNIISNFDEYYYNDYSFNTQWLPSIEEIIIYTSSKNFFPVEVSQYRYGGIIFTTENGIVYANGTATTDLDRMIPFGQVTLPPGQYIVSGCINQTGQLKLYNINSGWDEDYVLLATLTSEASEVIFTLTERTTVGFSPQITSGMVLDNQIYKPMIRLSLENDNTFKPFDGEIYSIYYGSVSSINSLGVSFYSYLYTGQFNASKGMLLRNSIGQNFLGNENWIECSSGENKFYQLTIDGFGKVDMENPWYISSHFPSAIITENNTDIGFYAYTPPGSNSAVLNFRPDPAMGINNLNQWISFIYDFADMEEYDDPLVCFWKTNDFTQYDYPSQFISSLIGQNYIWSNCGSISIELEEFYSDFQKEFTSNLLEKRLLYNLNNNLVTSNHYVSRNALSINSNEYQSSYNLYINGSTLTNGHIVLKNDGVWHANGDNSEPSFQMIGKNDKRFKFKFSNSGTNVDIGWDWTLMDGSGAFFRNSDATSNPGGFGFFARKPNTTTPTTADCSELYGYSNGLLFWRKTSGDSNPRFAINATSSNYTLYVNGTTYLKGDTKISANTSTVGCTLQYDDTLNTLNFVFD